MAVRSREEILNSIRERVGEQNDDETIAFIEDVTDTFTDLETRAIGDGVNWKVKYEENDANWRKKYTDRFFSGEPSVPDPEPEPEPEPEEKLTFESLFKEE